MATKIYFEFTLLTGGTSAALDSQNGNTLHDGDLAFVVVAGILYVYQLDFDLGLPEAAPQYIVPDLNPGSMDWVLLGTMIAPSFNFNNKWKFELDGNDLVLYYYDAGWIEHDRWSPPV